MAEAATALKDPAKAGFFISVQDWGNSHSSDALDYYFILQNLAVN